jgi:hypothetical protein
MANFAEYPLSDRRQRRHWSVRVLLHKGRVADPTRSAAHPRANLTRS